MRNIVDESEVCRYSICSVPLPKKPYKGYCSKKCAEDDARDYEDTERDKWDMRYEM